VRGRWLVLTMHHIATDGWSAPILVHELLARYRGEQLPPVPPLRAYHEWLSTQDKAASLAAWHAVLDGAEPTTLASAGSRPRRARLELELLQDELSARARELGVTLGTWLQTAWAVVLGRLTGREDVVFGTTVSGRSPDVPGIESMIGLFANT